MVVKKNIIRDKSFDFAVRVVNLYKYLIEVKKEYILSKQLLKCGTSVGAMVREAEHAESKSDFIHKMAIAQKEINETVYWLELLKTADFLTIEQYESVSNDAVEILRMVTKIIKTAKTNINHAPLTTNH